MAQCRRCKGWGAVEAKTRERITRASVWVETSPTLKFDTRLMRQTVPQTWDRYDPEIEKKRDGITYGIEGISHMVMTNQGRLIDICAKEGWTYERGDPTSSGLLQAVRGAIDMAFRKASQQPARVIPGLYLPKGLSENKSFRVQLLLPIHLHKCPDDAPNCALTLEWHAKLNGGWSYSAATILTIHMAYRNARLLNSVESAWAKAAIEKEKELSEVRSCDF